MSGLDVIGRMETLIAQYEASASEDDGHRAAVLLLVEVTPAMPVLRSQAVAAAGVRALLEDAKAHRQLTPTELDIERLVAGELAGPELEQLLRRGR